MITAVRARAQQFCAALGLMIMTPVLAVAFLWPVSRDLLGLAAPGLRDVLTYFASGAAL